MDYWLSSERAASWAGPPLICQIWFKNTEMAKMLSLRLINVWMTSSAASFLCHHEPRREQYVPTQPQSLIPLLYMNDVISRHLAHANC